ncbi:MAG: HAMP domain-containing protein, partial [Actinobacteria bacterium]|nr:HAMP domain-containing protein [Actinomycetota bacterium]
LGQARGGAAFSAQIEGGAEVLVPVLVADTPAGGSTVVVRTVVSDEDLTEGVRTAWIMLSGLGLFIVVVAALAADRLGRTIVRPVTALSRAARSLGGGDLDTRVDPAGPMEVAEVGEAFNFLAARLRVLLEAERESIADLSHRLRTPLTALRLQAETLTNREEAATLLADIDSLERAVSRMI